jgi:hypothetical protein
MPVAVKAVQSAIYMNQNFEGTFCLRLQSERNTKTDTAFLPHVGIYLSHCKATQYPATSATKLASGIEQSTVKEEYCLMECDAVESGRDVLM